MAKHRFLLILGLLLSACSTRNTTNATVTAPAANPEMEALYRARTDSARLRFVQADVQFMHGMIAHHAQAILMARLAPTHGASSAIMTLTGRIINAQQDEINLMQQWLRDRKQTVPEVHIDEKSLAVHGADHMMPGMLSPDQLRQLDAARGAEFDRLFLTFMIQHHKGAVSMVTELFNTHGAGQEDTVFKLASDVQIDQITEIDRMEKMLAALRSGR
jgi:uncharacterized protein (DUF305 family)